MTPFHDRCSVSERKCLVFFLFQIEKHLEIGGEDDAAEILISFLFRYGSIPETAKRSSYSTLMSPLNENTIVAVQGNGSVKVIADMGSVFQLENCIWLFQACYFILRRKLQKPSNDPSHSLLGYIIDARLLRQQRLDCHQRIPGSMVQRRESSLNGATFPTGLPWTVNSGANIRPRFIQSPHQKRTIMLSDLPTEEPQSARSMRKVSHVTSAVPAPMDSQVKDVVVLDTDDEAEQLKAGYGIFASENSFPRPVSNASPTAKKRRRKEKR